MFSFLLLSLSGPLHASTMKTSHAQWSYYILDFSWSIYWVFLYFCFSLNTLEVSSKLLLQPLRPTDFVQQHFLLWQFLIYSVKNCFKDPFLVLLPALDLHSPKPFLIYPYLIFNSYSQIICSYPWPADCKYSLVQQASLFTSAAWCFPFFCSSWTGRIHTKFCNGILLNIYLKFYHVCVFKKQPIDLYSCSCCIQITAYYVDLSFLVILCCLLPSIRSWGQPWVCLYSTWDSRLNLLKPPENQ